MHLPGFQAYALTGKEVGICRKICHMCVAKENVPRVEPIIAEEIKQVLRPDNGQSRNYGYVSRGIEYYLIRKGISDSLHTLRPTYYKMLAQGNFDRTPMLTKSMSTCERDFISAP